MHPYSEKQPSSSVFTRVGLEWKPLLVKLASRLLRLMSGSENSRGLDGGESKGRARSDICKSHQSELH